ncbi:ras-related protein Rab-26 isoform X4 [Penaeus vannamei]|uniref:ras-related protein Rab-26 isoform X4 n=1 Tax=Penaeus vannamei TaxID=6689 RepID=UPI00387F74F6
MTLPAVRTQGIHFEGRLRTNPAARASLGSPPPPPLAMSVDAKLPPAAMASCLPDDRRRSYTDFEIESSHRVARPQVIAQNGLASLPPDSDIPKGVSLRRAKSLRDGRKEVRPKRYSVNFDLPVRGRSYDADIDVSALGGPQAPPKPPRANIPEEDEDEEEAREARERHSGAFNSVALRKSLVDGLEKVRRLSGIESDPSRPSERRTSRESGAYVKYRNEDGDWQQHKNKVVTVDGSKVKLQIWDTAGQERFRSVTHAYYRDAHALLLLYDVMSKTSFDNTRAWLGEVHEYAQDDVVIMLIGNKCDVNGERVVRREDGERLAREYNVAFMETSAKTGLNVDLAFMAVARELKARKSNNPNERKFNVADYVRQEAKSDGCVCNVG